MKILQYIIIAVGILALAGCAGMADRTYCGKKLNCDLQHKFRCEYQVSNHAMCASGNTKEIAQEALKNRCIATFGENSKHCSEENLMLAKCEEKGSEHQYVKKT